MNRIEISKTEKITMDRFIKEFPSNIQVKELFFGLKELSLKTTFNLKHESGRIRQKIENFELRYLLYVSYIFFLVMLAVFSFLPKKMVQILIAYHIDDFTILIWAICYLICFLSLMIYYFRVNNPHLERKKRIFCKKYNINKKQDYQNTIKSLSLYQDYLQQNNELINPKIKNSSKTFLSIIIALQYANDIKIFLNQCWKWATKNFYISFWIVIITTLIIIFLKIQKKNKCVTINIINQDLLTLSEKPLNKQKTK